MVGEVVDSRKAGLSGPRNPVSYNQYTGAHFRQIRCIGVKTENVGEKALHIIL